MICEDHRDNGRGQDVLEASDSEIEGRLQRFDST